MSKILKELKKEVQNAFWRGFGGVPQYQKVPHEWGIRGLTKNNQKRLN
jgi:hypothetical protein